MNPGFAGIDNELYTLDQTLMLFGDAKQVIAAVAKALAEDGR
jgi:NAD(P) transhydrogenase subunit beta